MSVTIDDTQTPVMRWQWFATLNIEHDSDINSVIETPQSVRLVTTAIRICQVVVHRQLAESPIDDTKNRFRVVVELRVRITMHNVLHMLVVDVGCSVDANARFQLPLQSHRVAIAEVLVVLNLTAHLGPERFGEFVHPLRLLDAGLVNLREDSSEASEDEAEFTALLRCVLAHIDYARHIGRSEIQDGGAVSEMITFLGLGVIEVEQGHICRSLV